jgi:hypothetical protein
MRFIPQGRHDPDDGLVVLFKNHIVPNATKTQIAGRPMFDDMEVCEIRAAGARDYTVQPALARSHWETDPETGQQVEVTYAERFPRQYRQFKAQQAQTKAGTPLTEVRFLTDSKRAELRALNIYTVEALAIIDGAELKNLGPGGRELKNQCMAYIEESKRGAPNLAMQAELEALRARNAVLEEDAQHAKEPANAEGQFASMTLDELRDYITTNTGHAPHGSMNRKVLVRMAQNITPKAAAA